MFSSSRISSLLQATIGLFAVSLFWFAFIYYPKVASDYATGRILPKPTIFTPVVAKGAQLPIQTSAYRVSYAPKSQTYYVFVSGKNLEEFVFNRDNAKLALKTALSTDKLCSFNVIYIPAAKLSVPQKYLDNLDC